MPANDDALRELFRDLSSASNGVLSFRVTTTKELGTELGVELGRSPNPIYDFTVTEPGKPAYRSLAYTLTLDGTGRAATRAEALGKGLEAKNGALFASNPFLLIYDYVGARLLAVPAIALFGAFAKEVGARPIAASDTSTFSLTPSFQRNTISMYATIQAPEVWSTSTLPANLSLSQFIGFLNGVRVAGNARIAEVPEIVSAIRTRLASVLPSSSSALQGASLPTTGGSAARVENNEAGGLQPGDEDLRVSARLWRMILNSIVAARAVILVGPPGTGKTALIRKAIVNLSQGMRLGGQSGRSPLWATPDESWTARELIGGETVEAGNIVFRPGWVLRSIAEDRWLVLDESNRGDLDRIFGGLLTWLSGGTVVVGVESAAEGARVIELGWTTGSSRVETLEPSPVSERGVIRYLAGDTWRILGTYNALDAQRVFRFGAALGRRFVRVPIPAVDPESFRIAIDRRDPDLTESVRDTIAGLYTAHFGSEATRVGPALFLGMSSYIRAALKFHVALAGGTKDVSDAAGVGVSEPAAGRYQALPAADSSGVADVSPPAYDERVALDAITEAYVVNIGALLAQLEEPDFAELKQRLIGTTPLLEGELSWISEMIRALA